eukprot:13209224-Ditylum_brightwellii.AAC.1
MCGQHSSVVDQTSIQHVCRSDIYVMGTVTGHFKSLSNLFMRDGIWVDGARLDDLKKSLSSSKPGGIGVVLKSHAHMKPRMSCYYDSSGGIVEVKSKIDSL